MACTAQRHARFRHGLCRREPPRERVIPDCGSWLNRASASGTATADASAVRVACRFRASPGYQYGLSKQEQDYIYGSRHKCLVIPVHPRPSSTSDSASPSAGPDERLRPDPAYLEPAWGRLGCLAPMTGDEPVALRVDAGRVSRTRPKSRRALPINGDPPHTIWRRLAGVGARPDSEPVAARRKGRPDPTVVPPCAVTMNAG